MTHRADRAKSPRRGPRAKASCCPPTAASPCCRVRRATAPPRRAVRPGTGRGAPTAQAASGARRVGRRPANGVTRTRAWGAAPGWHAADRYGPGRGRSGGAPVQDRPRRSRAGPPPRRRTLEPRLRAGTGRPRAAGAGARADTAAGRRSTPIRGPYGAQGTTGGPWGGPQAPNSGGGQLPPQTAGAPLPHEGAPTTGTAPRRLRVRTLRERSAQAQGPAGRRLRARTHPRTRRHRAGPPWRRPRVVTATRRPTVARLRRRSLRARPQPRTQGAAAQARGYARRLLAVRRPRRTPPAADCRPLPPVGAGAGTGAGAMPPVAAMDEGATQYLPPVPAAPAVDEGATQYIPPVGPGALPPEVPAGAHPPCPPNPRGTSAGSGRRPGQASGGPGAGPLPPAEHPDAQATQFIAPVPAQPARGAAVRDTSGRAGRTGSRRRSSTTCSAAEPEGPPSTQQLPRFDPSAPRGAQAPQGRTRRTGASPGAYGAQDPGGHGAQAPGGPGAPAGGPPRGARARMTAVAAAGAVAAPVRASR